MNIDERVARKFSELLAGCIGAENLKRAAARNAKGNRAGCASHDFCDANMVMAEAILAATGAAVDIQSDSDARLWGASWDIAREHGFYTNAQR